MHTQQRNGFKSHFRVISEPGTLQLAVGTLGCCTWARCGTIELLVLIHWWCTSYIMLNAFLVYVTGPRANTNGHVINLCVNLTCSTLTRDTNLKHKYTNPTMSSSSFIFLIYIWIQYTTPSGSCVFNQTPCYRRNSRLQKAAQTQHPPLLMQAEQQPLSSRTEC